MKPFTVQDGSGVTDLGSPGGYKRAKSPERLDREELRGRVTGATDDNASTRQVVTRDSQPETNEIDTAVHTLNRTRCRGRLARTHTDDGTAH